MPHIDQIRKRPKRSNLRWQVNNQCQPWKWLDDHPNITHISSPGAWKITHMVVKSRFLFCRIRWCPMVSHFQVDLPDGGSVLDLFTITWRWTWAAHCAFVNGDRTVAILSSGLVCPAKNGLLTVTSYGEFQAAAHPTAWMAVGCLSRYCSNQVCDPNPTSCTVDFRSKAGNDIIQHVLTTTNH